MSLKYPRQGASSLIAYSQSLIDRIVKPEQREKIYNTILSFAKESPLYFTFLALQFLLSAFPIILFTVFASSTILVSLSAAILFSFFWIGVALCLLIPTLFFTTIAASIVFSWAACSFLVGKWLYEFVTVNTKNTHIQSKSQGNKVVGEKNGDRFTDAGFDVKTAVGEVQEYSNGKHTEEFLS